MSDLFESRSAAPMLVGAQGEPFDDDACIFELKLDGERCLAYLGDGAVELRNKRNNRLAPKFPEFAALDRQVRHRCILDGELTVLVDGAPSFSALLSRIMQTGKGLRARLDAEQFPASFTAFDILYLENRPLVELPLMERKALLAKTVRESERLAVSRYIETRGVAFYELAKARNLEGIVAKYKDSVYRMGKRTSDWIKIKNMQDDDFVICGWIPKERGVVSLVLGQYRGGALVYCGHVTLAAAGETLRRVQAHKRGPCPFPMTPPGHADAVWLKPELVCMVTFMHRTAGGGLRQPVFKGLRTDKLARECIDSM